ncbi:AraC family transcriptional regulator [Kordiimonas sp. SCSIO 12610]|uniref:AraC family transcriptional regulator n=1 Tax=Kordiimonas sp. SCSIO 12610 TaxID=2829597 RepID=UPI00210C767E|nr:AraC family transcriptional regulator [Kordiimonas sp. SCSIO 12610]UTW55356.1 AraC family transcriptional regulator [Kordiimonas sp. SCSIO 12610]
MDVLSDVLDVLKFSSSLYFTTSFGSPWGVKVPRYKNVARFHLVTQGSCYVRVNSDQNYVYLEEGDFLIIPHGVNHDLKDSPESPADDLQADDSGRFDSEGNYLAGDKASNQITRLVCGHFEFSDGFRHPLLEQLPSYIHIGRTEAEKYPWFVQILSTMAHEAGENSIGHSEVLKRMSEILFIHTIRMWNESNPDAQTFLAAVNNPYISRCLASFHASPNRHWSVDDLAKEAGMSRTSFNEKFASLTGYTPMNYVTLWRIQKAQRLLLENEGSVDWIAHEVGYESVAAFSRTFKKIAGEGPGAFRRNKKLH